MLHSLRNRLIISHLLPLLILLPLVGIATIYILETRMVLPGLSNELATEARLVAELVGDQPGLWQDQERLAILIDQLAQQTYARLMFLNPEGLLLASSDPNDENRLGTVLTDDDIAEVQEGTTTRHVEYNKNLSAEVIDVFTPVYMADGQLVGIIRMSYPYLTISDELMQMRYLILGILAFTLLVGIGLGSFLAVTINTPIQQLRQALDTLAREEELDKLEVSGPDEIKSLVRSINHLFERLISLEKARKQLLANLVHEIGRPLGSLRSAIHALTQGAEKDPRLFADLTNGMDAQTIRLQHLLNDLAHLHDQAFGSLELDRQKLSPNAWLLTILPTWEEEAHQKGLHWAMEIPENLPDLEADPFRLAQALENLLSNAIKFTPKGGTITVTANINNDSFWIKVTDTGPGIPIDEQEKVFAPFYRGDQNRVRKDGMGLGLSIAQEIVSAHKGEISLESKAGVGSSFTIWIPLT